MHLKILTGLPRALERVPILIIWTLSRDFLVFTAQLRAVLKKISVCACNVMQHHKGMRQAQTLAPKFSHATSPSGNNYLFFQWARSSFCIPIKTARRTGNDLLDKKRSDFFGGASFIAFWCGPQRKQDVHFQSKYVVFLLEEIDPG